jgi:hypothetical protein
VEGKRVAKKSKRVEGKKKQQKAGLEGTMDPFAQ